MSKFDYPILPRHEIVSVLEEFQIATISESDLLYPKHDFVVNLYTRILLHLNFLLEDHGQIDFSALEHLENPDHHVDSVRTMNLFDKIRAFVTAAQCPKKFTLRDLIMPEPDRTEFFLGTILNFCLYRETKMNVLSPLVEDLTAIDEKRQEYDAKILQLNEEIEEYNNLRESEIPLVQEVEAKVKELRQTIPSLNNHQMSLKASIKKMKEKTKEMDDKISNAEFALLQTVQENANLRSKIVQSPDKLQKALEERRTILAEARDAERSAMLSLQEKTSTHEVYTKAYERMSKHFAQMEDLQEQVNSAKAIEKDVKVLKLKQSDERVLDKSLEAKLVERQGKVDQLNELIRQLEKEREVNCEAATKELANVKFEVESRRRGLESRQRDINTLVAEVDAIDAKINSVKESSAAKQQQLGLKAEEIVKEFDQYTDRIGQLYGMDLSYASTSGKGPIQLSFI